MATITAKFIKGIVGDDDVLYDGIPQIAFVGRSNVGKSSVINAIMGQKELAKSSPRPGKTSEINFFQVDKSHYLVDLPGYGFAEGSWQRRERLMELVHWYVQNSAIQPTFVVVVDAKVGLTENDQSMIDLLKTNHRQAVVVANKIDKLKKNEVKKAIEKISAHAGGFPVFPCSAKEKIGTNELRHKLFSTLNHKQ